MGKKAKFSKEVKITACENYKKGKGLFGSIAKEVGCGKPVFIKWYYDYIIHGEAIFDDKPKNASYTMEFKQELKLRYNEIIKFEGQWMNKVKLVLI